MAMAQVTDKLADSLGEGYPWLDGVLATAAERWESFGFGGFMAYGLAVGWGVAGFIAAAGLGAGLVLGLVALIAAIAGGVIDGVLKGRQA